MVLLLIYTWPPSLADYGNSDRLPLLAVASTAAAYSAARRLVLVWLKLVRELPMPLLIDVAVLREFIVWREASYRSRRGTSVSRGISAACWTSCRALLVCVYYLDERSL